MCGREGSRGSCQGQCSRVCALLLLLLAGVALFISSATPILLATLVLISPYIFVHFSSKRQSLFIIWGQTPLPAAAPPHFHLTVRVSRCRRVLPSRPLPYHLPPLCPCVLLSLLSVGLVVAFIIDASLLLLLLLLPSSCSLLPALLSRQQIERPMLQLPIPDCSIKINANGNVLMAKTLPLSPALSCSPPCFPSL